MLFVCHSTCFGGIEELAHKLFSLALIFDPAILLEILSSLRYQLSFKSFGGIEELAQKFFPLALLFDPAIYLR